MNKTEQILKAKYSTQPTKLSKDELHAKLIASMLEEQQEEKEEPSPPSPAPAEQPKQAPPPKQEEVEKQAAHVITVGKPKESKEAVAPLSKAQVESRLSRLDKAIDDSSHHLMRGMLKATREKVIRDNVPIITTNVQKSASDYKYSMSDMHLVVAHLKEKGASNADIERALLYMAAQKEE